MDTKKALVVMLCVAALIGGVVALPSAAADVEGSVGASCTPTNPPGAHCDYYATGDPWGAVD